MPTGPAFTLNVETDSSAGIVRVRLTDEQGRQLGANQVRFDEHSPALWQGLFDTRSYVRSYAGSMRVADRVVTAVDLLEQIGVFLGQKVLGSEITAALHTGRHHRSLLVRQPEARKDGLSVAFARVPWEIARPAVSQNPLLERNLVVRMETPGTAMAYTPPPPGEGETLRVLLVFAEAPGSRPLAMRLERERLLGLFYDDVMPRRRVAVDVLCHGVTRESLRKKIREASGYHVVHWSGHGHHNLLELLGEDGEPDLLTGSELVDLFADAGGFTPQLVFLSACLSGTLAVRDWAGMEAALRDGEAGTRKAGPPPEKVEQLITDQPGYTGTALALLDAGVPQVVAMRYEVGDAYARDLAVLFYRLLLADANPKTPVSALSLARSELLKQRASDYDPVDHATPLLFGRDMGALPTPHGRSDALSLRRPQPQPILTDSHELDRPAELVGRGQPLSKLRECLEEGRPAVALVQGLAGLGKTALVAEAVHLWHSRFDGVFAFQAKPLPLGLDDFLRRLDMRLAVHSQIYRELCEKRPNVAVYLPPGKPLSGDARWRQMRDNLLEAMRNERLLLVLDNFETNLEKVAGKDGYACADPEWDHLLRHLSEGLPGSGSRLLVTSRHRLTALAWTERVLWLPLGSLPLAEAMLFLQGTEALRRLAHDDEAGRKLALRLLEVSRGHPLILTRLGVLAGDRQALTQALDELESKGINRLPDVFAPHLSAAEREKELAYLEDVAVGAVDVLIQRISPNARQLLWLVTLAFEPVTERVIEGVWSGRSKKEEFEDQLRALLARFDELPEELRGRLRNIPPEIIDSLETTSEAPVAPSIDPLLVELIEAGILAIEDGGFYEFHELFRERISAWLKIHPEERGGRTEEQVWASYSERYVSEYQFLRQQELENSLEQAMEAGRRGFSYLIRARDFDRLKSFGSAVITSMRGVALNRVIAELEGVVEQAPEGDVRLSVQVYLADALARAGHPDKALPLYERTIAEAEATKKWGYLGWAGQNCAIALTQMGRLDDAKSTIMKSIAANREANLPVLEILGGELEKLRIDIMQGQAHQALPEVNRHLQVIRFWWRRHRSGQSVTEFSSSKFSLSRVLMTGLNLACQANQALNQWEASLSGLVELEEIQRTLGEGVHELAVTRMNTCGPLLRLGRVDRALPILESCLEVFRGTGDPSMESKVLLMLAELWEIREDREQASGLARQALAVCDRLPHLADRAIAHGNLAMYLERKGSIEEGARHRLARIVYDLVSGLGQFLKEDMHNLAVLDRLFSTSHERYELPRLADLLARTEFEPLKRTLAEWNVPLAELQAKIDGLVEGV